MFDERTNLGQQVATDVRAVLQGEGVPHRHPAQRPTRRGAEPRHAGDSLRREIARRRSLSRARARSARTLRRDGRITDGPPQTARTDLMHPRMAMHMEKRPALGKGLSALIPGRAARPRARRRSKSTSIASRRTTSSRARQSTTRGCEELAQSIRANGIIQPIVVRQGRRSISDHRRRTPLARRQARRPAPRAGRRPRRRGGTGAVAARDGADREHPARGSESDRRGARAIAASPTNFS